MPTPYDVLVPRLSPTALSKRLLVARARRLERIALQQPAIRVIATLQDVRHLTDLTRSTYASIAAAGADVTLLARDLPAYVAPGVRGVALTDDDPLVDVWSVLVAGAAGCLALAAQDRHDDADDLAREYDTVETDDAGLVVSCLSVIDELSVRHIS